MIIETLLHFKTLLHCKVTLLVLKLLTTILISAEMHTMLVLVLSEFCVKL